MPKHCKQILMLGLALFLVALAAPGVLWVSLTHQPRFYRTMVSVPPEQRQERAKRFVAQSLQLYNDIRNEPRWEAVFTDQEVNAWLAEHLVTHFADELPPEIHEPRIVFEPDRLTLAFQLDQGPIRSVIWVVARVRVPEKNMLELTIEKIRAGVVPVPADQIIERITNQARKHGLDICWVRDGEANVALIRYTPDLKHSDVILEQLLIRRGQIRLAGRSNRIRGALASPVLPTRKVLQSTFPRRNTHLDGNSPSPLPTMRSSAPPTS